MEIVVDDARFFKSCIDAVVNLVDEGSLEVTKNGLHLRTMDPSQIAMVDFLLPKEAFSGFDVEEERTVGINLVDLSKILARSRSEEKLTISLDEKESRILLKFEGQSKRYFKLPLLDLGGVAPKEPRIQADSIVRIRGGALKEMLKDAGLLSSHVVLEAGGEEFVVEAHGDSGELRIETPKKSENIAELKSSAPSRAMFPYEYLDDMTRACPEEEILEMNLKTDMPIKLSYQIKHARLTYYLAPR
ncbi:proliferating cell nuclear antigen (pcna), partial [Candidatus Micrarchaeota archaeon]|nr:proliferating cell nuclear antigen (pcna) [Candidatus Micrarchaeota archaeon]